MTKRAAYHLRVMALGLSWLGLQAGAPAAGPNLLKNPGFEEGQGNYTGVGKYWETNDAASHPEVNVLTSATKHSGTWSQWLKANASWDLGMVRQVSGYNTITPGKTYRASAWIKTANVGNPAGWYVFGIWWFNAQDGYMGDVKMPRQETNNYDWREISFTAVAPPGAARVAAILTRHTDGDAWYDDVFIGEETVGPPTISIAPSSFTREVIAGINLPGDTFTIQNTGGSTLNYTLSESASWLSVSPTSGASSGEADTIAITYTTAVLAVGSYATNITISASGATNTPVNLPVNLTVIPRPIPGDMDNDRDVDQTDFGLFQACFTGPGASQDLPACAKARLDADPDVDQADFLLFQQCMTGADLPGDPNCTQ